MRLSLLLQREPFGEILKETMTRYWSADGVRPRISWGKAETEGQVWRGNIYLNFFCVDGVDPACFEIIKREFGHSPKRSRRWLQAAYVQSAVRPPTRNWLSQVRFSVSNPVPRAEEQLLIGGNRRLRMIHPSAGKSYVIQKQGFSRLGFDREVAAREGVAAAVAPEFYGLDVGGDSFAEAYFIGTPSNRLPREKQVRCRDEACALLMEKVHRPSLRTATCAEYLDQLIERVNELAQSLVESMEALSHWLCESAGNASIGLVFSHGDFQDANILVNGEALHLIDWENATERSQLYDLATMSSGIRLSSDSVQAWCDQVEKWFANPNDFPRLEVPAKDCTEMLACAVIWWMEEMIIQLEDAHASSFAKVDSAVEQEKGHLYIIRKFVSQLSE